MFTKWPRTGERGGMLLDALDAIVAALTRALATDRLGAALRRQPAARHAAPAARLRLHGEARRANAAHVHCELLPGPGGVRARQPQCGLAAWTVHAKVLQHTRRRKLVNQDSNVSGTDSS
eukprot:COSAG04_NODE_1642_length_6070_cov_9.329928_12_plen_119_part_01